MSRHNLVQSTIDPQCRSVGIGCCATGSNSEEEPDHDGRVPAADAMAERADRVTYCFGRNPRAIRYAVAIDAELAALKIAVFCCRSTASQLAT